MGAPIHSRIRSGAGWQQPGPKNNVSMAQYGDDGQKHPVIQLLFRIRLNIVCPFAVRTTQGKAVLHAIKRLGLQLRRGAQKQYRSSRNVILGTNSVNATIVMVMVCGPGLFGNRKDSCLSEQSSASSSWLRSRPFSSGTPPEQNSGLSAISPARTTLATELAVASTGPIRPELLRSDAVTIQPE